jgi:hypothetical protein
MMLRKLALTLLLGATLGQLGCGSKDGAVPVSGVVMLEGQPLADANVVLHPVTAAGPGPFVGTTDAAGKFSLGPSAGPAGGGAVPGEYRLTISTLKTEPGPEGRDDAVPKVLIPERVPDNYSRGNMRFIVPEAGNTDVKLDVSGP